MEKGTYLKLCLHSWIECITNKRRNFKRRKFLLISELLYLKQEIKTINKASPFFLTTPPAAAEVRLSYQVVTNLLISFSWRRHQPPDRTVHHFRALMDEFYAVPKDWSTLYYWEMSSRAIGSTLTSLYSSSKSETCPINLAGCWIFPDWWLEWHADGQTDRHELIWIKFLHDCSIKCRSFVQPNQ